MAEEEWEGVVMEDHERARVIAGRVAARVREVAPPGLGRWDLTWDLVAAPSDAFLDSLSEWEEADTPTGRSELSATATALVEAWAESARQWEAAGRPEPEVITV